MLKLKKLIIKNTVKVLNNIAETSAGLTCMWYAYQPKEPKLLNAKINSKLNS